MPNTRICMDGRMLGGRGTGVSTYAAALRDALGRLARPVEVLVDGSVGRFGERQGPIGTLRRSWQAARARPLAVSSLDGELHAPDIFRRAQAQFTRRGTLLALDLPGPAGVMHWTYPVPAYARGWRNLYTLHDLIPLTHPHLTPIDPVRYRRLLEAIRRVAAGVATVSEHTSADVRAHLGADLPVTNCYQAVLAEAGQGPDAPLPAGLENRRYLLVCGTVEPRKNIARTVAAWQAARTDLPLVIVGPDGWNAAELEPLLAAPGIVRLPYQPPQIVAALQAKATALVFASLAEGFGLPIVEAMARGTAVITSSGGATEEVAGGAALLVDPLDAGSIAAAMRLAAAGGQPIDDLRHRGRLRAQAFTPDRFADRLAALYG